MHDDGLALAELPIGIGGIVFSPRSTSARSRSPRPRSPLYPTRYVVATPRLCPAKKRSGNEGS